MLCTVSQIAAAVLWLWLVACTYATTLAADASRAGSEHPSSSGVSLQTLLTNSDASLNTTATESLASNSGFASSSTSQSACLTTTRDALLDPHVALPPTRTNLCPSRTVNYITHTLPQQCLRTDWVASRSEHGGAVNGATGVNGTLTAAVESRGASQDHGQSEQHTIATNTTTFVVTNPTRVVKEQAENIGIVKEMVAGSQTVVPDDESSTLNLDLEHGSPLDDSKFLSFEEWKKQNLVKAGQSPDTLEQGRVQNNEPRRRPINNALDTLGDEGEIELDFSGFGEGVSKYAPDATAGVGTTTATADAGADASPARQRSRDAGKTCKERFNYASFDCAATVLKTNPRCKSSSSVLVENKDSYMLNECSTSNKFIIIELCDDILIDTIVVANFEFFSSMFRTFRVSVSDRYPVKLDRWKDLGTFEARNSRDIQAFLVENPLIWARYLRLEFVSHYGSEFYCPVSLVRVHGTTMMEEFRHQEDIARGDDDSEELIPDVQPQTTKHAEVDVNQEPLMNHVTLEKVADRVNDDIQETSSSWRSTDDSLSADDTKTSTSSPVLTSNATSLNTSISQTSEITDLEGSTPGLTSSSLPVHKAGPHTPPLSASTTVSVTGPELSSTKESSTTSSESSTTIQTSGAQSSITNPSVPSNSTATIVDRKAMNITTIGPASKSGMKTSSSVIPESGSKVTKSPGVEGAKSPSAPAPQPPTQDSFFKTTNKRLMMLETNSSLNIQYIEEQSRILRDAFVQTERHQLRKTETFLQHLNDTVMAELRGFRQQYDQIWQSTVIELEESRERHQKEMSAVSARLTLVADELIWQKRMIVVQSVLLLLSLGLVVFAQKGKEYLDMPLMQQALKRSQSMLKLGGMPRNRAFSLESPTSPSSPVSGRESSPDFRRRSLRTLGRLSSPSGETPRPDSQGTDVVSTNSPLGAKRSSIVSSHHHVRITEGPGDILRNHPHTIAANQRIAFQPSSPAPTLDECNGARGSSPSLSLEEAARAVQREAKSSPSTPSGSRENQPLTWYGKEASIMQSDAAAAASPVTILSPPQTDHSEESDTGSSDGTASFPSSPLTVKSKGLGRGPSPLRFSETDADHRLDNEGAEDREEEEEEEEEESEILDIMGDPRLTSGQTPKVRFARKAIGEEQSEELDQG